MCVCVREREREGGREGGRERELRLRQTTHSINLDRSRSPTMFNILLVHTTYNTLHTPDMMVGTVTLVTERKRVRGTALKPSRKNSAATLLAFSIVLPILTCTCTPGERERELHTDTVYSMTVSSYNYECVMTSERMITQLHILHRELNKRR